MLCGGAGNDTLQGGVGNDRIEGNDGADVFLGGLGADIISMWDGDGARDSMVIETGDSGRTRTTIDVVEGFASGEDVIDLRAFAGMTFEDLDYAGAVMPPPTTTAVTCGSTADGDRASDMILQFKWVDELVASDFLFV